VSPPEHVRLPARPDVTAPDGSDVRVLVRSERGSMAHFELAPGQTSQAVRHLHVEELWFVVGGTGEMWLGGDEPAVVTLEEGVSLRIPPATPFQFRATGDAGAKGAAGGVPLAAVAVTMPPWPLDQEEAVAVDGPWTPTVVRGGG
jgi:mannose-6-phosphate isomerase-like protein (cupin superfamily)